MYRRHDKGGRLVRSGGRLFSRRQHPRERRVRVTFWNGKESRDHVVADREDVIVISRECEEVDRK
jgi:hypothetical protein